MCNRDAVTVYHTLREFPSEKPSNGSYCLSSLVYIDVFKKANYKDVNVLDELDKLAWTVLCVISEAPQDLNFTVEEWQFFDKQLWRPSPSSQTKEDIIPDDTLNAYICQIALQLFYKSQF